MKNINELGDGRDYLKEAYEIAEGKSNLLPEVAHIKAVVEYIKQVNAVNVLAEKTRKLKCE